MSTATPGERAARLPVRACVLILCITAGRGLGDAGGVEPWFGVSVGTDLVNFDPMPTLSLDSGLWPDDKKFGYQAYLEFADPACDDEMWTIGAESIFRLGRFYGGIGLSLSDERLCDRAGTKWNFSIAVGMRISERLDVQWRHRSHGEDLGIRENTSNDGVNLVQLRWRFRNR